MKRIEIPLIWVVFAISVIIYLIIRPNLKSEAQEIKSEVQNINANTTVEEVLSSENLEETTIDLNSTIESINEPESVHLEDVKISKDMDLSVRTGLSKEDFVELIKNLNKDTSGFFAENAEDIYDLCEEYSINELFFCGLIAEESGWNIASNHRTTHNYISLMSNGSLIRYNSVYEGLEIAASQLHNNYLEETGRFYHGSTLSGVKKCFCPSSDTWVDKVYNRMQEILKNA